MGEEFDEESLEGFNESTAPSLRDTDTRLIDLPYFHGKLSRKEADAVLAKYVPNDCFLVRQRIIESGTDQRDYQYGIALHTSDQSGGEPKKVHFRVRQRFDFFEIGGFIFNSIPELVEHYSQNEIYPGSKLLNPIKAGSRYQFSRVMATLSYTKSDNTDELSFAAGDVFNVQYDTDDTLWVTHVKSNESGSVYKCMVEQLDSPNYDPDMEACEFYHPGHRDERLEQLKSRHTGDYFLRPSATNPNISVLCVNCIGVIKKFEIQKISTDYLYMSGLKFSSIDQIIAHYSKNVPIDKDNKVYLAEPLLKRNLAPNVPADDIYSCTTSRERQMDKKLSDVMDCMLPKRRKQRNWKRQRCVLSKRDNEYEILILPLECSKRSNAIKPKGLIALEFAHLYPVSRGTYDKPHCLQLVILHQHGSAPPDTYVLAADSAETLERWCSTIKPLCVCASKCNRIQKKMKHVSTLDVTISCVRNLSVNCKLANVTLLFNGVAVAKTRSNRREQDDDMTINWDEQFLFDFPECVTKLGFHLHMTKFTPKLAKYEIEVNSLMLGSTTDFKLRLTNSDKPILCCKVRRVSHAVLPSKEYVPIRDIILQNVSTESGYFPDIVQALADVCPSEDLPHLARAVFRIFACHNREAELLIRLLLRDIQSVTDENEGTLLRNTTVGTAALEVYLETKEPVEFVRQFLEEMVQSIVKSNINLELNSSRLANSYQNPCDLKEVEAETQRNAERLTDMLTKCLIKLHTCASSGGCPRTLRAVSAACQLEVTRRFPQAGARVLSTIFFLRLFCPALTTKFRLIFGAELHAEASPTAMRSLQIAAKALLLFANQSRTFRETFMEKLKGFVSDNSDIFQQLNSYLTSSKTEPANNEDCENATMKQISLTFELASLHDFCKRHLNSLTELQNQTNSSELKNLIKATEFLSSKLDKGG